MTEQPVGRIGALRFGNVSIEHPPTYFSQDKAGGFAGLLGADGIIGTEILRRYTAIWDYPNERLMLEPNRHIDEPFTHDITDLTGLYLLAEGSKLDTIRVTRVIAGSAAESAGMGEGDAIVSIDGRAASEMTLEDIRRLFIREGTYRVGIERGRVVRTVVLELGVAKRSNQSIIG